MKIDTSSMEKAIRDAWDFYLEQHPLTLSDITERSIYEAVKDWMDQNQDLIVSALRVRMDKESDTRRKPSPTSE